MGVYFVRLGEPRHGGHAAQDTRRKGRGKKTRLSKPRVSRALHAHLAFASACLKNAKKIGLVLQASVYWAKNDCNACGFERNNKYHVNQEFNVLF